MCDDFREMDKKIELELWDSRFYDAILDSMCEFSEKSLEAARKNYKSLILPERQGGKLVEHDKDLYVRSIYNYVFLFSKMGKEKYRGNLLDILGEINDVFKDTPDSSANEVSDHDKEVGQAQRFTEEQYKKIEVVEMEIEDFLVGCALSKSQRKKGTHPDSDISPGLE